MAAVAGSTPEDSSKKDTPGGRMRGKCTVTFGEITIDSNFDSGNLDKVEECKSDAADTYEFNLWTAPDCAGTEYETSNRTWFYFSVATPHNFSGKTLRFNIQNMNRQFRLYQQGMTPLVKTVPGRGSWERLRGWPECETVEGGMRLSFQHTIAENRRVTTYFAFCYPYSYSECQKKMARLDERFRQQTDNVDIYYHRELLCYSLEGLRVDLLTISSCDGITTDQEPRFPGLFPDASQERARTFKGKKVIFVSSRVHPGETPSSHVFNGFLDFILRPDDPRAHALRKLFVFKLIPMLNPDGVYWGHYRMNTRGVNLNRVYLNPNPELHPSIYAARCIILHHHKKGGSMQSGLQEDASMATFSKAFSNSDITPSKCHIVISECKESLMRDNDQKITRHNSPLQSSSVASTVRCSTIADSVANKCIANQNRRTVSSPCISYPPDKKTNEKEAVEACSGTSLCTSSGELTLYSLPKQSSTNNPASSPQSCSPLVSRNGTSSLSSSSNSNCNSEDALSITKQSGIALYIDLHAHATKRGCFLYGNYFQDETEQTENMLFPKLVALNSPHLDFDHCVFSEKNMYTSDKRDGMSKEGSGRVAIYKATGIIHSYTLECNYNSGRQCNAVSTATLDNGRASPPHTPSPMAHKYSITDYEQVGRALAVSALDMCQMNPWSRLPTGDYGCLAGVRHSVMLRIRNSRTKRSLAKLQVASTETSAESKTADDGSCTVQTSKSSLLHRQKVLATSRGSDQIAADFALLTEVRHMQFSLPNRVGCKKLLSGRGCGPAGFNKKRIQASQPVETSLWSVVFPSTTLCVSGEDESKTSPGRSSCKSNTTPPPNLPAVNSKGGKFFSDKVSGSDKKLTTKISPRNLLTRRLKSGVRGEDYSLNIHHLPLVQQRRKLMMQRSQKLLKRRDNGSFLLQSVSKATPTSTKTASDSELIRSKLPANDQRPHCSSIVIQAVNSKTEGYSSEKFSQ